MHRCNGACNTRLPAASRACPAGSHACGAGGRCAPAAAVCDGHVDCDDGSDEADCDCAPASYKFELSFNLLIIYLEPFQKNQ